MSPLPRFVISIKNTTKKGEEEWKEGREGKGKNRRKKWYKKGEEGRPTSMKVANFALCLHFCTGNKIALF